VCIPRRARTPQLVDQRPHAHRPAGRCGEPGQDTLRLRAPEIDRPSVNDCFQRAQYAHFQSVDFPPGHLCPSSQPDVSVIGRADPTDVFGSWGATARLSCPVPLNGPQQATTTVRKGQVTLTATQQAIVTD
jgi:hypothetical protein